MKKIGLLFKEISVNRIKSNLKESESVFVINYSKLSSPDLSNLRQSLRSKNASLFVVKNNVALRALKGSGLESLIKTIVGPCGLVFIKEEPVGVSRVLYNFSRDHEALRLSGGYLKERVLDQKDIETLARLPTREVLRAQVTMFLKSPLLKFAIVLRQTLLKFIYCLEQIRNKKEN